jgi:phosphoglycolate phosphatase
MYRACIFDLDGTLTDTLDSLEYSVNETMKETGMRPITKEQCRAFVGNGAKVLIEKALRASGDEELAHFDEAFSAYQRIFDANCTYKVKPYPGVPMLLGEMKKTGMKLGVLSNKPDKQAVHVVADIFGRDTFDSVHGQRDGIPRKPDPAPLLALAKELGAEPAEVLYIGDSEVDVATGRAAQMDTIAVSWGFRSREELKSAGADRIADTADEILQIIKNRRDDG